MATESASTDRAGAGGWLDEWKPEDTGFWEQTGRKIAWRTLTITTITLILSFATWFLMRESAKWL